MERYEIEKRDSSFSTIKVKMSSKLFKDVKGQFIDEIGKCRALIFDGVAMAISPLPPADLPVIDLDDLPFASIEAVVDFVKDHDLEIVEQNGSSEEIKGVWVRSIESPQPIVFGYLYLEEKTKGLPRIPYSGPEITDPLLIGRASEISKIRKNHRIANYLKQSTLIEWANDPDRFDLHRFYIDPDHEYKIENAGNRIRHNDQIIFYGDQIIVPDEETAKRLLHYVKVSDLNDSTLRDRYSGRKVIDSSTLFTSTSDFRQVKKQLIFMDRAAVRRWKIEQENKLTEGSVFVRPISQMREPYYYRNFNIEQGRLMIIKNTDKGELLPALKAARSWENRNQDLDLTDDVDSSTEYNLYNEEGKLKDSSKPLNLFQYNNGTFGAIFFL